MAIHVSYIKFFGEETPQYFPQKSLPETNRKGFYYYIFKKIKTKNILINH
jgi:hypothetical protein